MNSTLEELKSMNRQMQDLTPILNRLDILEEKIDSLAHQNRDRLTAELNLLSTQVGKIQEEPFTKTEKGLKKIRIAVYRITVALVISIISITALVKGCLALLNISKEKGYDEDDTAAISLITGLSAASVCILIELIKNARDKDLTEDYIEEMVEKLGENEENELGGMNMQ